MTKALIGRYTGPAQYEGVLHATKGTPPELGRALVALARGIGLRALLADLLAPPFGWYDITAGNELTLATLDFESGELFTSMPPGVEFAYLFGDDTLEIHGVASNGFMDCLDTIVLEDGLLPCWELIGRDLGGVMLDLARARREAEEAKSNYDKARAAWEREHADTIAAYEQTKARADALAAHARQHAVFKMGHGPFEGGKIVAETKMTYDDDAMKSWIIDQGPLYLSHLGITNRRGLNKVLRPLALEGRLEHVTVTTTRVAKLDRDLSKLLEGDGTAVPNEG